MSGIKGYMDNHYEPVFEIEDGLPDSVRHFMYKYNLTNNEVDLHPRQRSTRNHHTYLGYTQSKSTYKTNSLEIEKDEKGRPIKAHIGTKEVKSERLPVYICKSRISLGIDRSLMPKPRVTEWDREQHVQVTVDVEGEEEDKMIFRMRHDISWDWLSEVCDDEIIF